VKTSVERARRLIARPGAWLDAVTPDQTYALRLGPGRRHRPIATLDEAAFRALVATPGLRRRASGGWEARSAERTGTVASGGSPGRIEGTRTVMDADGRARTVRANLAQSALDWLARHRDASGRPWLTSSELAAGERLRRDADIAQSGPSVTMRWDALPRSGGGSAARVEPGDRALAAGRRVAAALDACGPRLSPFVVQICIRETALQTAERTLGVPARQGKTVLKAGLQALAAHYGIG
jgi:hypothetical protein